MTAARPTKGKRAPSVPRGGQPVAGEGAAPGPSDVALPERALLLAVFDAAPEGIVVCDAQGRLLLANRAAEELYGRPAVGALLTEHGTFNLRYPDGTPWPVGDLPLTRAAMHGETCRNVEMRIVQPDGRTLDLMVNTAPVHDGQGRPAGAVGVFQDITSIRRDERRLERAVQDRTADIVRIVDTLREEVDQRRRAEAALGQTNELLERMFASIHMLIAYMDRDFNFIRVNRAYAQADGHEPDYFVGKNHFKLFPDRQNEAIFRRVVRTGEPFSVAAKTFVYADHPERGTTHWDWSLQPVKDRRGRVIGLVLCLVDVTERVRAESALRQSEQRFKELAEAMPDVVWLSEADLSRVLYANSAYETVWGRARERLYADSWDWVRGIHPDDRERVRGAVAKALRSNGGAFDLTYRIIRPDGGERVVHDRSFPLLDEQGRVRRLCGIALDMTPHERARDSERRLAAIIESSEDAIISVTPEGLVQSWNSGAERLYGYAADEAIGRIVSFLAPSDRLAELNDLLGRIRAGEPVIRIETVHRCKDGILMEVALTLSPTRDGNGRLAGISIIARDITEHRRLEREVLEASQVERRRVGQDLHDTLGQDLTAIAFLSKLLSEKLQAGLPVDPDEAAKLSALANQTIRQTRAIARGLCPVDVQADGLMVALERLAGEISEAFRVPCRFVCTRPVPVADAGLATQLYYIAREAANNAARHACPTRIDIELEFRDHHIVLVVRDDGIGLAAPVDSARTTGSPGAAPPAGRPEASADPGMGLRIMQHRAHIIGGRLRVQANADRGTTVTCRVVAADGSLNGRTPGRRCRASKEVERHGEVTQAETPPGGR